MSRSWLAGVFGLTAGLALVSPAVASWRVRAPMVEVQPGAAVYVRAPLVRVVVPVVPAVPVAVDDLPPAPVPPTPRVVAPRLPLTVEKFVDTFRPCAGTHDVVLVHPWTGRAVEVRIPLPAGPCRVFTNRRVVEFDYGRTMVVVRFWRDGSVSVRSW